MYTSTKNPSIGTCCLCLDARHGSFAICAFIFFYSLVTVIGFLLDDVRYLPNGYNPVSRYLLLPVAALGVVSAGIGYVGISDLKPNWLSVLNVYQALRLIMALVVFFLDLKELQKCDTWQDSQESVDYP